MLSARGEGQSDASWPIDHRLKPAFDNDIGRRPLGKGLALIRRQHFIERVAPEPELCCPRAALGAKKADPARTCRSLRHIAGKAMRKQKYAGRLRFRRLPVKKSENGNSAPAVRPVERDEGDFVPRLR